jgi:truncated hemoglobin YjbI
MTVDERLEFLLKSTESLHATIHELFERMDREHERMNRVFNERLEASNRRFDERFDRLLSVVEVLAETARNHEHRISDLEQRQ